MFRWCSPLWAVLLVAFLPSSVQAQNSVQRILFLYPDTNTYPATTIIGEAAEKRLNEKLSHKLEVYAEFLDQTRFAGPEHERRVATYLASKYAGTQIDAVIAIGPSALRFIVA